METFRLNFHCLMGDVVGGSLIFWRQIRVRLTGLGEPKTNKNAWLVVWNMTGNIIYISSIWNNISQWEGLSHIL